METKAAREGKVWQVVGVIAGLTGMGVVAAAAIFHGVTMVTIEGLTTGLIGAFILLGGLSAFLTGRTLGAIASGYSRTEAQWWRILGWVLVGAGAITIVFAGTQGWSPTYDQLATGLAGSFSIMAGLLALFGGRLLHYAAGRGLQEVFAMLDARNREKSEAASADG